MWTGFRFQKKCILDEANKGMGTGIRIGHWNNRNNLTIKVL